MIEGSGKAAVSTKDAKLILSDIAWVPKSTVNLISLGALMSRGSDLRVDRTKYPHTFELASNGTTLLSGSIINNLFVINMTNKPQDSYYSNADFSTIHQTLGHASLSQIKKFLNIKLSDSQRNLFDCLSCDKAKITCASFNRQQGKAQSFFEKIHLDLIVPINPTSKGGFRYVLTLIDSHSGYLAGFPLRLKSNTADTLTS